MFQTWFTETVCVPGVTHRNGVCFGQDLASAEDLYRRALQSHPDHVPSMYQVMSPSHFETVIIYQLDTGKLTTQIDINWIFKSKRVVI